MKYRLLSVEAPVVAGRLTLAQIEELVAKPMDTKPDKKFFIALTISGNCTFNWSYLPVCTLFIMVLECGEIINRLVGLLIL